MCPGQRETNVLPVDCILQQLTLGTHPAFTNDEEGVSSRPLPDDVVTLAVVGLEGRKGSLGKTHEGWQRNTSHNIESKTNRSRECTIR